MDDGKRQNSLKIKAFSVCRYYIVTAHLRHSRAGGRRGCENPVGNPRAYQRQLYAGHLHPCDHRYAEKRFRYRGELYG